MDRREQKCGTLLKQVPAEQRVVVMCPSMALERDDRERWLLNELDVRSAGRFICDLACDLESVLDRCGVRVFAVRGEREPERESAGSPRQMECVVRRIPFRFIHRAVEIRGALAVSLLRDAGIAIQQRTRVERREQPLVRIDDERVGAFDS
jgi:hypothetical protein